MVFLRYLVPTLAILLVGVLGVQSPQSTHSAVGLAWYTLFAVFFLTLDFDRSRGRWISYVFFTLLTVYTAGLYIDEKAKFLPWISGIFFLASWIAIQTQIELNKFVSWLLLTVVTCFPMVPALISVGVFSVDESAWLIPIASILGSLIPLLVQYSKTMRPRIVWPLLSLQQFVLRISFVVWCYEWKPVLLNSSLSDLFRLPLLVVLALVFLIANIRASKVSWPHVSLTTYSLTIIFIALFKHPGFLPFLMIIIAISAYGGIFPIQDQRSGRRDGDLAALEVGAFGSGVFVLVLWGLYKIKSNIEPYEFSVWCLFFIFCAAKIWSQSERDSIYGVKEIESSPKYYYSRLALQVVAMLYFIFLIMEQTIKTWVS